MSHGNKIFKSAGTLIAIRFIHRFIGLVSILFLARILTPSDFGLVAIVSIVVHFFDTISNVGSEQYIIQKEEVTSQDLNTAWTLNLIAKVILWLLLALTSPAIATFFEKPNLTPALILASTVLIIGALKSPSIFILKRDLKYTGIFKISIIQKVISFFTVIVIAFYYRSYWALIIGEIISGIIFSLGTYFIHPHRPKLRFIQLKEQWSFSQWLLLKGIVGYTRSQIDTLIVAKFFPAGQLGKYQMNRDLAMMPSHNILAPASEPLLTALRSTRSDINRFRIQTSASLYATATVAVPIFFFIWHFPIPILETILGEQWLDTEKILSFMALLFLYFSFILVIEQALLALQKVKLLFYFDILSLAFVTLGLLTFLNLDSNLANFALLRGLLGLITTIILLAILKYYIQLSITRLCLLIFPIFLVAYCTVLIIKFIQLPDFIWPIFDLLSNGILFCLLYTIFLSIYCIKIQKVSEVIMFLNLLGLHKFSIFNTAKE